MRHAVKELMHSKKRYLLIEIIVVLLMFMVLFLSGLANGLGRAVTSAVENIPAKNFVISDTSENLLTVSRLDTESVAKIKDVYGSDAEDFSIQRMYLEKGDSDKLDVIYIAARPGSFVEPKTFKGRGLDKDASSNEIVLDDDFIGEGIRLGDRVKDSNTDIEFKVVGFVKDQMYGHVSAGYITADSLDYISKAVNPVYKKSVNAVAINGTKDKFKDLNLVNTEFVSKDTVVNDIPGYSAEQSTIQMIKWVLVVVSAIIIGIFFYILTIQKEHQLGVMKALGMGSRKLSTIISGQVGIIALAGASIANVLAFVTAHFIPQAMPFYLPYSDAFIVSLVFVLVSLVSSLISIIKIAGIDPVQAIGGAE